VTARLFVDAQARLGECPLWCERTNSLWWTDIEARTISRRDADGQVRHWIFPEKVGSFAFCAHDSRLLLGLASGIALFDPDNGHMSDVVPLNAGDADIRINDGRCDRQGRFVFGMFNKAEAPIGHFYRVSGDLRIERLALPPAGVGNSIAFSPDGATMYYADSPARTIFAVDYRADGSLGEPRLFVKLPEDAGFPDGSTVDGQGGLWNAQWLGSCAVRYDGTGRETARFTLPVSKPTCPVFGGPQLDELYVTSARLGLEADALAREPAAGGVIALSPGCRGLPETRFALAK
jgi:L-arabinonolactonase